MGERNRNKGLMKRGELESAKRMGGEIKMSITWGEIKDCYTVTPRL